MELRMLNFIPRTGVTYLDELEEEKDKTGGGTSSRLTVRFANKASKSDGLFSEIAIAMFDFAVLVQ